MIRIIILMVVGLSLVGCPAKKEKVEVYVADWCGSCPSVVDSLKQSYDVKVVGVDTAIDYMIEQDIRVLPYIKKAKQ